jgi:DNA repair protein RadA/Sms
VRRVAGLERRLREGERAGFGRFLHPGNLKRLQEAVEAYLA